MFQGIGGVLGSGVSFDIDAKRFIDAAGITDANQRSAINALVRSAKTNGWWSLCSAIYPFVGGTASSHKWNLKNPVDSNAAFRLSFSSGWTHASTGATPNGSAYADTFIVPNVVLTSDNTHLSYYSRTNVVGGNYTEIGMFKVTNSNPRFSMELDFGGSFSTDQYTTVTGRVTVARTATQGLYLSTRTTSAIFKAFKNGTQIGSTQTGASGGITDTYSIFLGGVNNAGVLGFGSTKEVAFASIGAGISDAIAALMYTDVQNYQTALGRQV